MKAWLVFSVFRKVMMGGFYLKDMYLSVTWLEHQDGSEGKLIIDH